MPSTSSSFDPSSRNRLTTHDLGRFSGDTLFDRAARVVCEAGCLPRKELYESWEVARRARRRFRGGRVLDVGGGHGLLAHFMLLLDDTSPEALVIDPAVPPSASVIHRAFVAAWPRLEGRIQTRAASVDPDTCLATDVLVSCHACGALTDRVLEAAMAARARLAVLPCCHDEETCEAGPLRGWMDVSLAIDVMRVARLTAAGAVVQTQTVPRAITPKNRLLLGVWP